MYREHVFKFSSATSERQLAKLNRFLDTIGPVNACSITQVEMHGPELWVINNNREEEVQGQGQGQERGGDTIENNNVLENHDETDANSEIDPDTFNTEDGDYDRAVEVS